MSTPAAAAMARVVEYIIPILRVGELGRSIGFYTGMLPFKVEWQTAGMAAVSRDGRQIMLCQGDQGSPGTWVWIGVADIEPLHMELKAKGVAIALPPTDFGWAYEFRVRDPDGHMLRFGSESPAAREATPAAREATPAAREAPNSKNQAPNEHQ